MDFRFYEVTGVKASFSDNYVLKLSVDQAKARAASLEDNGGGAFKVLRPVEFKKGEKIGVGGDHANLNKAMLLDLTEMEDRDRKRREREIKTQAEAAQATAKQPSLLDKAKSFVGLGGGDAPAADQPDIPHSPAGVDSEDEAPV